MKKAFWGLTTIAMLTLVSCKESEENITPTLPKEELPEVLIESNLQVCYLKSDANKIKITFETNSKWEISLTTYEGEQVDWISASPSSGNAGSHQVELNIKPNQDVDARLIRLDVRTKEEDLARSITDDILNDYQAVTFTASILQYGYYNLAYGEPIKVKPTNEIRLQTLIDEYIQQNGGNYSDFIYLNVNGILLEEDFDFIRENLTELKVLDMFDSNISEIPDRAFNRCFNLHYITLPLSLKRIGEYAFCQSGLKSINPVMPPYLEYVGWNAFADTNIGGSIIFSGLRSTINISGGAFYSEHISTAIFSDGITTMEGDIVSPFIHLIGMHLPTTLKSIACGYINNVDVIYCYPIEPPITSDRYGIGVNVDALFVPNNNGPLEDNPYAVMDPEHPNYKDSHWSCFYTSNPEYNKMFDVL